MAAEFTVTVGERTDDGHYEVIVATGSGEYARTSSHHLDLALQMAVPYMTYACEPDPLADVLRRGG